jgi:beta-N-acetylhexosaminidase
MDASHLAAPPFNLDAGAREWVAKTIESLSPREKAAQLFILFSMGDDPAEAARLAELKPAGITRFFGSPSDIDFLDGVRAQARVPLLVSADLEGSRMSLPFGTQVPNPLALAAVDDIAATTEISCIMAQEARAVGINWSFTPVLDINTAFRSPIVATRGFGSDPDRIERHALAQIAAFQQAGIAATVKHWPGEGHDDRDQHLVTTVNPLDIDQWERTHGRLYRSAIEAGVLSVMSAHIAFPAFIRMLDPQAGLEAFRPASVSRILNEDLLRRRLGFNGVIVSDATPMAGFGSWAPRETMLPEVIANGCDLILFTIDPEAEIACVERAIDDGRISRSRLEAALMRVLGLKAALGLHRGLPQPSDRSRLAMPSHDQAARAVTARAPTLVKDVQHILPLSPSRFPRVLVHSGGIVSPLHEHPFAFEFPDLLRAEGFEVTVVERTAQIPDSRHDLLIYLLGEETLLTRGRIFLDWLRLTGNFQAAMRRSWHEVPTMLVSFGYPYYLYDAPRMPCVVNAYATMPSMQAAVVDCLVGRAPWAGRSPVDPFCGLEDARW